MNQVGPDARPVPARGSRIELASQGARFINALIDGVASYLISLAILALGVRVESPWILRLGIVMPIVYYVYFELTFQATLGKFFTRTRVVTVDGGTPSFGQIVGRTLLRVVPFDALSYLGRDPIGWHDRWSGTLVVRLASLRRR
jgi:uncharacterized RDD family membrane protein YckC